MFATLAVLGGAILVVAAASQPFDVGSYNVTIIYNPPGGWSRYFAPGGFEGTGNTTAAYFASSQTNLSAVNWTTPYPTVTFEWWGYQRSDGGNATISFDDGPVQVVDYYNKSSPGSALPVLLYSTGSLSPAVHKIYIHNQLDVRGTVNSGYGQMNVDHFVIIPVAVPTASPTVPTSSSSPTSTVSHSSTPAPVVQTSSNNAGAIAGGVVGGVAGLALIAVAVFLMRRRIRNANGDIPPLMAQTTDYPPSDARSTTPRPGGYWGPNPSFNGVVPIYDPNDPSTFPPPMTPPQSATASPGRGSQPQQFPPEL